MRAPANAMHDATSLGLPPGTCSLLGPSLMTTSGLATPSELYVPSNPSAKNFAKKPRYRHEVQYNYAGSRLWRPDQSRRPGGEGGGAGSARERGWVTPPTASRDATIP